MIGTLRKFSTSIYSKILLGIIVIPFVFWGMGSGFRDGDKNIVVTIDKDKFSAKDFVAYVKKFTPQNQKIDAAQIESLLSKFIGEQLIINETKKFNIYLSDKSLSKLIKNQKEFQRDGNFSRVEYEKFLLQKGISAFDLEQNISRQEKKNQLLELISGGLLPSEFLVNLMYDQINQKRIVDIINLNQVFQKKFEIDEAKIKLYFENNKKSYVEKFVSINYIEVTPKNLIGINDYNELFFKKIDEIDDSIANGLNFNELKNKFNLEKSTFAVFNKEGFNKSSSKIKNFPYPLIKNLFKENISGKMLFFENDQKFFIVELVNFESIQKTLNNKKIKEEISNKIKFEEKNKFIFSLIAKINENKFTKENFVNLANDSGIKVEEFIFKDINDSNKLNPELVNQIYQYPKDKVGIAASRRLEDNFLVYIKNVESVSINRASESYDQYLNLSKIKLTTNLYNTYDGYIKKRYKIDINDEALDSVKNYFIF